MKLDVTRKENAMFELTTDVPPPVKRKDALPGSFTPASARDLAEKMTVGSSYLVPAEQVTEHTRRYALMGGLRANPPVRLSTRITAEGLRVWRMH
jgi:hypothetical protein